MTKLSIVVPCFNEEGNVGLLYEAVVASLPHIIEDTEIIFINDGSTDGTWKALKELSEKSPYRVKAVNFSRNFGKEAALLAGFRESTGAYTAVIDADMQQNPKYIADMVKILDEHPEYDAVAAYQEKRKESKILSAFKGAFYKLINHMADVKFVSAASDFRLLRRVVVDAILSLPERCRFSKGIFAWVGFETYYMPYTVEQRATGKSKWSFRKLFSYAVDGILAFSVKPLVLSSVLGFIFCLLAIIMMLWIVIKTLIFGDPVPGYPTLASLILLLSGVQLFSIGILGEYMAKNYTENKARPVYIVKEISTSEKEDQA